MTVCAELRVLADALADLARRRTMVINQIKAYTHLWLDHTPGPGSWFRVRGHVYSARLSL